MKVYNKFVESKKEPSNKSDIWFDGSSWKMYKEGMWRPFTISLEQAQALYRYVEDFKLFKIVDALPQIGQDNTIYLVENKDSIEGNSLIEYIYINDKWEEVGKFTPEINLDDYAKKSDIVQSDYNQNDNTAKDYIKNRTHYINDVTYNPNDISWNNRVGTIKLNGVGEIFIELYDDMDNDIKNCILNLENDYYNSIYTAENLVYFNYDITTLTLTISLQNGFNTFSITNITQKLIIQLDEEYIPSTIARKTDVNNKVDKITGKGLSTNDYTNDDKNKLSSIEEGAQKNVTPDWNSQEGQDGYIKNKPFGTNEKYLTIDDISSIDDKKGIYTVPIDYNTIIFRTFDDGIWHDITLSLDDDLYAEYIDTYESGHFIIQFTKETRQLELTFTDPEDDYEQAIIDHKIRLNKIKLLDANYISDTVIKTTPQILTEDEKTQVLSNLGISFIKYLISPHIVRRYDSQIPQDLNQILWSMKNYPLSFANNLMVCYVMREDETISYDPITLRYYEYDEDMDAEAFRFSFYDDPVYILADGRLEWL